MSTIPLWRQIQRQNFTRLDALADFLEFDAAHRARLLPSPRFALNLPLRLAQKIKKNTLQDPILRQFIPLIDETIPDPRYLQDPVGDLASQKSKKILQKYRGRALLLASSACAMNCRFCFRQNFPYETAITHYDEELQFLAADPTLDEVILSGGDPLSLSHESLHALLSDLGKIPHLTRIRFHTRFPIGIPERIDEPLLDTLAAIPKQFLFILHINHPEELGADLFVATKRLQRLGIPLLVHTVLLKEVNDDEETLALLFKRLIDAGMMPYYLNLLDRVQGSSHFEVPEERGIELLNALKSRLPGYGLPRLIREEAGKPSKTFVC